MPKPLVFNDAPKQPTKEKGPSALSFDGVPTRPTKTVHNDVKAPGAVSFSGIVVPTKPPVQVNPGKMFDRIVSPMAKDSIKAFKAAYAELYVKDQVNIDTQIEQLLPIKLDVVVNWGSKTFDRVRACSNEVTKVVQLFSQSNGSELIAEAQAAALPQQGWFAKMRSKDPFVYEAPLEVIKNAIPGWVQRCDQLIVDATKNHHDMLLKMAVFSTVADTVGEPPDHSLAMAMHNRRIMLQQGTMQAEMLVRQLSDTRSQMIQMQMQIDQMLNITLPAIKASQMRK